MTYMEKIEKTLIELKKKETSKRKSPKQLGLIFYLVIF